MSWTMNPHAMREMWGPSLYNLQKSSGIPAEFALTQFAHEALNGDNTLSGLAELYHNWAGLKFAPWQRAYGAVPVSLATNEFLNGEDVRVVDAFAAFPDTGAFLRAYRSLLTTHYAEALRYADNPLLYGYHVWKLGWATDPAYIVGLANRMTWLWESGGGQ